MFTITYFKLGTRWFLDYPQHLDQGGAEEDLEAIGGFVDFLNLAAKGLDFVHLEIGDQPFTGAEVAERTGFSGEKTGGYYLISQVDGLSAEVELWVNEMIYSLFSDLPERLYYKRAS
ncbi:DUF6717 family protein [Paraflavisolibacter sp. H34]|uniref:DUF6717 family protein n=1 Tax=Huijunlia imazamoxiresistens TaxID=3127457 RepID=UPI00301781BE